MAVFEEELSVLKSENAQLKKQVVEQDKRIAELEARLIQYENAHTPSSMRGVHLGRIGGNKSRGKPGRKDGHEGASRKSPEEIHQSVSLKLKVCPCCGGKVKQRKSLRERIITGIQKGFAFNAKYFLQRAWCGNCKKLVEPTVKDALPNTPFSLELALYVCFLSMLGITLGKIRTILFHDYALTLSKGTIANMLEKTADFLGEDYEKLRQKLLKQKNIGGDETSHTIHGKKRWLWTFIGETVAYLTVQRSRGQKVVEKILKKYDGILTSDCWSAYNKLKCRKQKCMAHLNRDMKFLKKKNKSKEAQAYSSAMKTLFNAALREKKCSPELKAKYENKLCKILDKDYKDKDCLRFNKRFRRHLHEIFTFLEENIEPTNNKAERSIRPWVIKRKNTNGSYSIEGAQAHAVLASFYQTSQLQKIDFEKYMDELIQNRLNPTKS
ncbi:MAG TPA: IS66 family transposase [archaeon]|nr:IS66 family transposase [archaeon]